MKHSAAFASAAVASWLAATVALATPAAFAADTRFGAEVGVQHENNVNRGVAGQERSDQSLNVEGYAARSIQTGSRSGFVTRFALRGTGYREFSDISHVAAAARFNWRFQPDPRVTGVWFDVFGTAELRQHADSDLRDGQLLSLGIGTGKYFTDALRLAANVSHERRFARQGTLYDLSNTRVAGTVDLRLSPAATVYGSAAWIGGDQVFTYGSYGSSGPGPYAYAYNGRTDWYSAAAWDPAFRDGGTRFTAYRAEASTTVLEIGLNYAFTGQQALDVSLSRFDARAKNGPSYEGIALRAAYMVRFR